MLTPRPRQGSHPRTAARNVGARLRRLAAALTAVTFGLLASAVTVPAAFARPIPIPPPGGSYGAPHATFVPATVRIVTTGGMAGWQITLIAVGAALAGAAAALLLVRARTAHRATPATST